jgi:hypothetical protein
MVFEQILIIKIKVHYLIGHVYVYLIVLYDKELTFSDLIGFRWAG